MVKRTLVVLGVLSLMLMAAGTSSAFFVGWPGGDCGPSCKPMYLPVDCPTPEFKTIVKTWQCKIEGPAPACGPAVRSGCLRPQDDGGTLRCRCQSARPSV